MKERPILMSAPMVRALLSEKKTQTRRSIKPQPPATSNEAFNHGEWSTGVRIDEGAWGFFSGTEMEHHLDVQMKCPYGKPGDRLWVRETWASPEEDVSKRGRIAYNADGKCGCIVDDGGGRWAFWGHGRVLQADGYSKCFPASGAETYGIAKYGGRWRSPIFMPRWASRITLEITEVRVQRLQEISHQDVLAEGIREEADVAREKRNPRSYTIGEAYRWAYQDLWESINGTGSWAANPWVWAVSFKVVKP